MEELKAYLEKIAANELISENNDDFCLVDYVGSNVDDAYYMGVDSGEVLMARELLEKFFS